MTFSRTPKLEDGDALIVVDVQNDFLPGGALAVPRGDEVLAPLNDWLRVFHQARQPVFVTRDWHPADHCSFKAQGGTWPAHCIAGTSGAELAAALEPVAGATIISKATTRERDAYSGFGDTDLAIRLAAAAVKRVFVGGLATDYCVLNTVLDARAAGYEVIVIEDAIRAVNVSPGDGEAACERMRRAGARIASSAELTR